MKPKSAVRTALLTGLALAAIAALWAKAPIAEGPGKTSLLVKCDAAKVPQVLRALAGLEVEIHDLETMKPLNIEQPEALARAPMPIDAYAVMESLREVAGALRIERMQVRRRYASILVGADRAEALDAFEQAWRKRTEPLVTGALKRTPDGWRQEFKIRIPEPAGELSPVEKAGLDRAGLDKHLTAEGTRLIYASAQSRRGVLPSGTSLCSRRYQLAETTLDQLARVLARLSAEPGLRVSQLSWSLAEKSSETPGAIRAPQFTLSWLQGTPRTK